MIARRTAVTNDLLADEGYVHKVDVIGDPLQKIEAVVDFSALAQAVERIAPRPEQPKGGLPTCPLRHGHDGGLQHAPFHFLRGA